METIILIAAGIISLIILAGFQIFLNDNNIFKK